MPKIITITANLLAETTSRFVTPKIGETARAVGDSIFAVGGKGVNVSRYAAAVGIDSVAVVFPAGFIGKRCVNLLESENFKTEAFEIEGETRQGLVCVDFQSNTQTTFLGSDIPIPVEALKKSLKRIREIIRSGDILALCGSFPNWRPEYAKAISDICQESNARFCADTYGAPLRDIANVQTDFLKFNKKELFAFLQDNENLEPKNLEDAFSFAREKCFPHAKIFSITDGGDDILFRDSANESTRKISPMKIEREISATGCGDALFAIAIAEIFIKQTPLKTALDRASKYASMCAQTDSTQPLSKRETIIALS